MAAHCSGSFSYEHDGIKTCSYCGSISVEDAIKFLKQPGTQFSGSDWKYGWPHKFYIEPVNPDKEKLYPLVFRSHRADGSKVDGTGPNDRWYCNAHGERPCTCPKEPATGYYDEVEYGTRPRLNFKFYNVHLNDVSDELLKEWGELSKKVFGIFWGKDEKGVYYQAPKAKSFDGFQRAGIIKENGEVEYTL